MNTSAIHTPLLSAALVSLTVFLSMSVGTLCAGEPGLRAGSAVVDIAPRIFPVIVNGMFEERKADRVLDTLTARALVLDDGQTRIAFVIVDSCMMSRALIDEAKEIASKVTGISTDHMLVSATHTHSAPAVMGCLGSRADNAYQKLLPSRIAMAIESANSALVPARAGWTSVQAPDFTHCRRWIRRPDKMLNDPFGERTVRANMHPGNQSPDALGPSGPPDAELSMLSVQRRDGKPIALLANFSMHYFGSGMLSSDYFGRFVKEMTARVAATQEDPVFVAMMSQGTSGDLYWADYSQPAKKRALDEFSKGLATLAHDAYQKISYLDAVPLAMRESKLTLPFRLADEKRMEWARKIVAGLGERLPRTQPEIYAQEQIFIAERPTAELKLQAVRIGELGIMAIPNEVFALTGLKIKMQSPLRQTFNIELANGAEGYIPPPEQHSLGGYTTWPARTAGLEVQAEPKIVDALLKLLEEVSGQPRRKVPETHGAYAENILKAKPIAYWRLNEFNVPEVHDATGQGRLAKYEERIALYLPGPDTAKFSGEQINYAPHFAGGRIRAVLEQPRAIYSVEMWLWNALPKNVRAVTGYAFSRGGDGATEAPGDHIGIGGTDFAAGRLFFFNGNKLNGVLEGKTELPLKSWTHVVFVRDGRKVTVYLNGNTTPDLEGELDSSVGDGAAQFFIGGRSDNFAGFEGKIDEVSIYDRALSAEEAAAHFTASGMSAPARVDATSPLKLDSKPLSPAQSIAAMRVRDGFKVELVAAEPMTIDPVAFDWGPDGKFWIVEMADYPLGMDGRMKPGGRVRYLEDTNGDGLYDKSVLFLENVRMPTGILVWRDGVLITAAPDIIFAADTDGDGKADVRKVLYSGFKEGNPQLRVNGLRWGLDNWIYCANGWSNGIVKSIATGETVDISGRDLRIRPDDGKMDAVTGVTQFGRERDDWDHWFGVNNSFPLWHYVISDRYLRRNTHVAPPDPVRQLVLPRNPKIYPTRPPEKRFHSFNEAGRFTSACSTMIYRDELCFKPGAEMHAFTCEPFHNLIHHEIVTVDGVSFAAHRAEEEKESEFVSSSDRWFRPVMIRAGPDGALWVADMCRYMIEHPDWLPPEGKTELGPVYRAGDDVGRIYRIVPKEKTLPTVPRLDKLNIEQLVAALDSASGWQRDMVQRLLVWRADKAAVPFLEKIAAESNRPSARAQALWTLDGLNALSNAALRKAFTDPHAGVREQAVRMAEPRADSSPELLEAVVRLVGDPDAKVRLQLACSLGEWRDPRAGKALGELAVRDVDEHYIRGAALSSAVPHAGLFCEAVLSAGGRVTQSYFEALVNISLSTNQRSVTARLLTHALALKEDKVGASQMDALSAFLDSLKRRKVSVAQLRSSAKDELSAELEIVERIKAAALAAAMDDNSHLNLRLSAVKLIGHEDEQNESTKALLARLLGPQSAGELQRTAVKALARSGGAIVPEILTKEWRSHPPSLRTAIVDELLSRDEWALALVKLIEAKKITPMDLDAQRSERLLKHKSDPVKALAKKVFAASINEDRQKVIDGFTKALELPGEKANGARVFVRACTTCHKLDGVGQEIGPDLRSVAGHAPEKLLASILDPSRAIEPGFMAFLCTLNSGEQIYGIIAAETGASISMKLADNSTRSLLRNEIRQIRSTNISLMPEGLETSITIQEMADLLTYLKSPASASTAK